MCEALVSIGNYWGVPVLNMCNDPQVPLLISRKPGLTINPYAIQQRRKAFIISEENGHPSKIGHEYRSTIIENYMRSL